MRDLERYMVLQVVDIRWREHLENMDYMREGIHLRGMAQKDPLVEYRNEGHVMFLELNRAIREEVLALLFHAQVEPARSRRPNGARGRSAAAGRQRRQRQPQLRAPDARRRRCDRRGRRRGATATAALAGGGTVATAQPVVKSEQREHRPQRPVLVRLGQEVQALPRRLSRQRARIARRRSARRGRQRSTRGRGRTTTALGAARGDRGPARLGP